MFYEICINSKQRNEFIDITSKISETVIKSGVKQGICCIYVQHTTAGLTINENSDPSVVNDILKKLDSLVPYEDGYEHVEGNSAAHIKASMMGFSENIIIKDGKLILGVWQAIYFTEFDGPRNRKVIVKIIEG